MASSHLKRIVAPKTWPVLRKTTTFISRPKPSGQRMGLTMPAVVLMRDMLGLVLTSQQARKVLRTQTVTVNGRRIHDTDSAVGFMDILAVGGKGYRLLINESNTLYLAPVGKDEDIIIQKVRGKTTLTKGRTQIACTSGRTLIVEKTAAKTNDSIVLDSKGAMTDHLPLAPGATVLLTGGNHIGKVGKVERIEGKMIVVAAAGALLETATTHAYVIGKERPLIKLNER
jgi:small subunit ribosomal protein S4e